MARIEHDFSPIGYGAFKIGRNTGIKYPRGYDLPNDAFVERLLNGVLDLGINYIDTAPAYGLSEERIGRAIGGRKREYFLSTKVGETFVDGRSTYDFSERSVRASIERSRNRLRAQVLDLVFVHADRDDVRVVEDTDVVPTLRALREGGVVRAIGLSAYTEPAYRSAMDWCDAMMVEYHPSDRQLERVIGEAAQRGVAVMVKKPLASGTLSAAEALPFILERPGVTSVVVGSLSVEHLGEDVRIAAEACKRRQGGNQA